MNTFCKHHQLMLFGCIYRDSLYVGRYGGEQPGAEHGRGALPRDEIRQRRVSSASHRLHDARAWLHQARPRETPAAWKSQSESLVSARWSDVLTVWNDDSNFIFHLLYPGICCQWPASVVFMSYWDLLFGLINGYIQQIVRNGQQSFSHHSS